jgi:hypothetical protein
MPYGSIIGGYGSMFKDATAADAPRRLLVAFCLLLPAATAFPRADVVHLAFVAALPAALSGALVARYLPSCPRLALAGLLGLGALTFPRRPGFPFFRIRRSRLRWVW